ncbi:methyltransferase domain-containing protein [Roseomonas sp. JC162]|uniref:Methyltransferase domain-containing protein n=1 Tax=Neoroseomonas marina TaxID=1232220 RepID=A0A848E8N5_9PROT|nr:methyltransferase domain-containing protein [Neoroseomonas marina]
MSDAKTRYGAADIRYVAAFDPDISPARVQVALALHDTLWNPPDRERMTFLDIGCGRGLTSCMLAAANPGWDVIGLDLQPVHIAEAREIAAEAGLDNARFIEADLAELDEESSAALLPEVDIVICNGVWTWVPDPVRQGIVTLLKSRLRAGGVVLMGYNSLPGFADCIVLQRILYEVSEGVAGSESEKGAAALAVLEQLRDSGSPYLPHPKVLSHVIEAARTAPAYMAHEWFTPFWRPVFHADLARDLAAARLDYGGPARPAASLLHLNLDPARRDAMAQLPATMDPETVGDAFLERRFRSDLFIRGRRPGGRQTLGDIRFALGVNPEHAVMRIGTQTGVANLGEAAEQAILGALAAGPQRVRDLVALPACAGLTEADVALMLFDTFTAHPLWRDIPNDPAFAARAARCNHVIARRLGREAFASKAPLGAVVPALGSAFALGMADLAVIAAIQGGVPADPEALARRLTPRRDDPDAVATVRKAVEATLTHHLGAWRALGVV